LVNLVGEYIVLSDRDFHLFVDYELDRETDLYLRLKGKHFIAESLSDPAVDLLAIKYRTKKAFLYDFTSLHMFVITQRCNQRCIYCQVSSQAENQKGLDMTIEVAKKAVDTALASPTRFLKIEFQGGEPLLNFETVKYIIEYTRQHPASEGKDVEFVLCTNLTLVTDEILKYLSERDVFLSISLDGPKHVHDFNRRFQDGRACYKTVIDALERAKRFIPMENISALMTATKYSLDYPREIVDEYLRHGFSSLFVRPLNPFGYARRITEQIGYSAKDFIRFYKNILEYLIDVNRKGVFVEEAFTSLLLTRILTPYSTSFVDLQFPSGTGISGVAYGHDGNVYLSDESRMLAQEGDYTFCAGNVLFDTFKDIFYNEKLTDLVSKTLPEALPGCCDCAFQIYCGIDPVRNYSIYHDIVGHRPTDQFCEIHKGIFRYLFDSVLKNERETMDVFWSWITHQSLSERKNTD